MAATSRSDLHFRPAQNEHPCGPNLRSLAPSGARSIGPELARRVKKKAAGPAVNVEAWFRLIDVRIAGKGGCFVDVLSTKIYLGS